MPASSLYVKAFIYLICRTIYLSEATFQNIVNQTNIFALKVQQDLRGFRTADFNMPLLSTSIEKINGYGCWCYFQDDHGKGKGTVINKVDQVCKHLHEGYECAIRDGVDEGDFNCVPWTVDYNPGITHGSNSISNNSGESAMQGECKTKNPDNNCAYRACMVEVFFVLNFVELFLSGNVFDPKPAHALGFNPDVKCPIEHAQNNRNAEISCCGGYPLRATYRSVNGNRGCCGNKTHNAFLTVCCENDDGENVIKTSCN